MSALAWLLAAGLSLCLPLALWAEKCLIYPPLPGEEISDEEGWR